MSMFLYFPYNLLYVFCLLTRIFAGMKWLRVLYFIPLGFAFFFFSTPGFAQSLRSKKSLSVTYFNVDRLYDTSLSENSRDSLFTPHSVLQWDQTRYQSKIQAITQVLNQLHHQNTPDILALTGFENQGVFLDLMKEYAPHPKKFQVVYDSASKTNYWGLQQALIFNTKKLLLLHDTLLPIHFTIKGNKHRAQDLLHVQLLTRKGKDTLHVFITELDRDMPGSLENFSVRRILNAQQISNRIRSIMAHKNHPYMILGSFYEEPMSVLTLSVFNAVGVSDPRVHLSERVNISTEPLDSAILGTYHNEKQLLVADQALFSRSLYLNKKGWQYVHNSLFIDRSDWMIHPYPRYEGGPHSLYFREKYIGGFGSHYPISFMLQYAKKRK